MSVLMSALALAVAVGSFTAPTPLLHCASDSARSAPLELAAGFGQKALVIASCGSGYSELQCTGTVISGADRDCPTQRGYVTCDGVTQQCPPCPVCTEGQIKTEFGPNCSCADGLSTPRDRYKCIGGAWVYQSTTCGAPFCPDHGKN